MADRPDFYTPSYTIDENLINDISDFYARALDRSGLNVIDPIAANIGYFNIFGKKSNADPPMIGRTHVFITRPNLNFRAPNNILRSRVFQYYFGTKLGRTLMKSLMHPHVAGLLPLPSKLYPYAPHDAPCIDHIIGGVQMKDEHDFLIPGLNTNFMPLLSNTCIETSNAKDITLSSYETDGDFSGNKLTYAAGADETMSIGEVNLTFDDIFYSPVMHTFVLWIMYIHYACKGVITPYWRYIVDRIIDYTCSIYVFMLDTDGETIVRYVKYGGCFPRSIPFGAIQHSQEPNTQALRNLSIPFAYNFYNPMDPIILTEFNMLNEPTLYARSPSLKQYIDPTTHSMMLPDFYANRYMYNGCANPSYDKDDFKSDFPKRAIDYVDTKNDPLFDQMDIAYMKLQNRSADKISNNFYGIPFIFEGNKLKFI